MVIVGAVLSLLVIKQIALEYETIVSEYEDSLNRSSKLTKAEIAVTEYDRTIRIRPAYLADTGNWLIDASGIFVSFMGPLIGLVVLHDPLTTPIVIVYIVVILAIVSSAVLFVLKVSPSGYPGQPLVEKHPFGHRLRVGRVWIFTPIVIFTVLFNAIAGVVVLVAGP